MPPNPDPKVTAPMRETASDSSGDAVPTSGPFAEFPAPFGRYRVERLLGRGAMGAVYLARDTKLDRLVALKVPRFLSAAANKAARVRFLREARAAATLHHPNLCPVFDADEIDGTLYLTMAYIEGKPLTDLMYRAGGKLPERQVAALVRKLALALAEAHSKGVIHRDLKPANIMIDRRGEPVVMDFGLAQRGSAGERNTAAAQGPTEEFLNADPRITRDGAIVGTPAYMSPEQADSDLDGIGPVSDVYSLGVILFELLTGRLPFIGKDMLTFLSQVMYEPPQPPSQLRPGLDPRLEAVCLKALAKKPEARQQSMTEFAASLTEYLRSTKAAPADGTVSAGAEVTPEPAAAPEPSKKPWHGFSAVEWTLAGSAAAVALAVILATVSSLLRPNSGSVRVELSEPGAAVEFHIDGLRATLDPAEPVLRLLPGPHVLEAYGEKHKPARVEFTVKRGRNPPLHVKLEPLPPPPPLDVTDYPDGLRSKEPPGERLAWPAAALRAGNVRLPAEMTKAKPWISTTLKKPSKFVAEDAARGMSYGPDGFRVTVKNQKTNTLPVRLDQIDPTASGDFGVQVTGRVVTPKGWWGVCVAGRPGEPATFVMLDERGVVHVGRGIESISWHEPRPGEHPYVFKQAGGRNVLLVILNKKNLEVYVNDRAVCDPVPLGAEMASPRLRLACRGSGDGPTTVQFESLVVAPAETLPPPERRGAVLAK